MGVGPAVAIPAVCKKAGVAIQDIDVFELNEAFASQAVYVIETLGLDENKINFNGGAIALGHRNVFFSFFLCPHFETEGMMEGSSFFFMLTLFF
jgi:hypothetical protein